MKLLENRGGLGEENEDGTVEARNPLFRRELSGVMPNENSVPLDEVDVESTFSAVLNEPPIFKQFLSSPLSNPGTLVSDSVEPVATGVKLDIRQGKRE